MVPPSLPPSLRPLAIRLPSTLYCVAQPYHTLLNKGCHPSYSSLHFSLLIVLLLLTSAISKQIQTTCACVMHDVTVGDPPHLEIIIHV